MADPIQMTGGDFAGGAPATPSAQFGQKPIGSEGWSPLDLLPVKWVWDAAVGAMTPQYEVPATAGQNTFQATAPTMPQYGYLDTVSQAEAQQQQARAQQMALNEAILARARGEGPSVAEMQLRQATDRLQGQQAGLIASQRGMNPALQRRLIMSQAANAQQQMNAQGALLRAQEQQAAQALGAQSLGQMRGQDQSMFGQGASANQAQNALSAGTQMDAQRINAATAGQNAQADWLRFEAQRQQEIARANANAGLMGGVASALTGAGGMAQNSLNAIQPLTLGGGQAQSTSGFAPMAPAAPNTNPLAVGSYKPIEYSTPAPAFAGGGMVPGYAMGGDNPRNDTVPAWLSPQEVVLPRSVTLAPDAPAKAAEFMAMMQARPQAKQVSPAMRLMRGGK